MDEHGRCMQIFTHGRMPCTWRDWQPCQHHAQLPQPSLLPHDRSCCPGPLARTSARNKHRMWMRMKWAGIKMTGLKGC